MEYQIPNVNQSRPKEQRASIFHSKKYHRFSTSILNSSLIQSVTTIDVDQLSAIKIACRTTILLNWPRNQPTSFFVPKLTRSLNIDRKYLCKRRVISWRHNLRTEFHRISNVVLIFVNHSRGIFIFLNCFAVENFRNFEIMTFSFFFKIHHRTILKIDQTSSEISSEF